MSDLEAVMERLLNDPSFQGALARNPDAALAGYTLTAEDRELLGVPVVSGAGGEHAVEERTTKSGVVGMLGPVVSAFGVAAGGSHSLGSAPGHGSLGSAPDGAFGRATLGVAPGHADSFGSAPHPDGATMGGTAPATETFGTSGATESFGTVAGERGSTIGVAPSAPGLDNYATRVDVDGDGTWDAHTVVARADGGVDIQADINNDGVVDFIGHDYNRDGLVDSADFDNNHDGVMETRMYDDNGDGWMDRSEPIPATPEEGQTFGNAPASA